MRFWALFWIGTMLAAMPLAARGAEPLAGFWQTEDQAAVVELYACAAKICGRFHWIKEPEATNRVFDLHNHDAHQRRRPLCQMQFMGGFTDDGNGHYTNGWIYNPEDGNTYDADMEMIDPDTLHLHGYLYLPLLGQSRTWVRVSSLPVCTVIPP